MKKIECFLSLQDDEMRRGSQLFYYADKVHNKCVPATIVFGEGDTPPKVLTHAEVVELFDSLIAVTKFIPQPSLVEALQGAMKEVAKRYITL